VSIPYSRPRGAIHDLAHLETLSACRQRLLCVSDRTLYLLGNLAGIDIEFQARYAEEFRTDGYVPVSEGSPNFDLFVSAYEAFQLEVLDMTCDIQAGLEAIAAAIENMRPGGACSTGSGIVNCVVNIDNDDLLGPGDSVVDPFQDPDPPEGFATWEEYQIYKCQAAYFIWHLERKHMVALANFDLVALTSAIVGPIIAGVAGVLPAAFTPAGFVVFVASVVAIGIVAAASWAWMSQMIQWWDDNQQDIVCALYNSGTSAAAVSALGNLLEDAIQAIIFSGGLADVGTEIANLLGVGFSQLAGNGIVEPLFKSVVAATSVGDEADCSACTEDCTGRETFDWGDWYLNPGTEWAIFSNSGVTIDQAADFINLSGNAGSVCIIQIAHPEGYCVDHSTSFPIRGNDDVQQSILLKCWVQFADDIGNWIEKYNDDTIQLNASYPSSRNLFFFADPGDDDRRVLAVRLQLGHSAHAWGIHLDRVRQQA